MIFLFATVGLVFAGPRKVKDMTPAAKVEAKTAIEADGSVPLSIPVKIESSFDWPKSRPECPVRSETSGLIQSKNNEIVDMAQKTKIYVQHKVDVDKVEDRCINMVRIEHMPDRGCKYTMIFNAKRGYTDLQLSTFDVHADSWCPGWRDWRETGETNHSKPYSRRLNDGNLSLTLSKTHVPDPVSDRSCTDLSIRAEGTVAVSKALGGRGEPFTLDNLSFRGQYDSVGEPSSICPEPRKIIVQKVEVVAEPQENQLKNTALVVYMAHDPLPNLPAFDIGTSVLQQLGEQVTARADLSIGPLNHNAFNLNFTTGTDSSSKLRFYFGARLGGLEDLMGDDYTVFGVNLGIETNRSDVTSPFYASLELTPVLYDDPMPNYISGSGETSGGIMLKANLGLFLRKAE
jgi:hypothetical protein